MKREELRYFILDSRIVFEGDRYFRYRLQEEKRRAERSELAVSVVTVDTTFLNRIVNGNSPSEGEKLLAALTRLIIKTVRETDTIFRQDNGTIAILLPATGAAGAEKLAGELRTKIYQLLKKKTDEPDKTGCGQSVQTATYPQTRGEQGRKKKTGFSAENNGVDLLNCEKIFWRSPNGNRPRPAQIAAGVIKRTIDIVGALTAIILLVPLMGLIAILIKLTSPGPVIFRQERIGDHNRRFLFYKFRTMYADITSEVHYNYVSNFITGNANQEDHGRNRARKVIYKLRNDPRITPFGRILRRSSLDELPQLFNVLKGEMSLVGPRPPIVYEFEKYRLWHQRRLTEVKPGITGLWQVTGRSMTTFDEMVRLDLKYVRNWSLGLDFLILLRTPWAVVSTRGAY